MDIRLLPGLLLFLVLYSALDRIPASQSPRDQTFGSLELTSLESDSYGFRLYKVTFPGETGDKRIVPILFLHGHRGSAAQGLPIASYLYTQNVSADVYIIDFKESPVALGHSILIQEAEYTIKCLDYLTREYLGRHIGVIGHSMGGVVAAYGFSVYENPGNVGLFIALSSPLEQHPVNTCLAFPFLYSQIHSFWKHPVFGQIPTLSITGGVRDLMVPPQLTSIRELMNQNAMRVYTTKLQGLSTATDHLAIAWSLQVSRTIATAVEHYLIRTDHETESFEKTLLSDASRTFAREKECSINLWPEGKFETLVLEKWAMELAAETHVYLTSDSDPAKVSVFSSNPIEVLTMRSSGLAEDCIVRGLTLDLSQLFIMTLSPTDLAYFPGPATIQYIPTQKIGFNFLQFLFLFSERFYIQNTRVLMIESGTAFSTPRYPIHLYSNVTISILHAKCGTEELTERNVRDIVLWLHEYCTQGPEIWLVFPKSRDVAEIEISIDWRGSVFLHFLTFRLTIWTFFISGLLLHLTCPPIILRLIYLLVFCSLWTASNWLRGFGFLLIDHVHFIESYSMGGLDLLFLIFLSQSGVWVAEKLLAGINTIGYSLEMRWIRPNTCKAIILISALGSFICPWISLFFAIFLAFPLISRPSQKSVAVLTLLQLALNVPEFLSWGATLYIHHIWTFPDLYDLMSLLAMHIGLYTAVNLRSDETVDHIIVPTALYINICGFDLLYRSTIALGLAQILLGLTTASKSKLNSS